MEIMKNGENILIASEKREIEFMPNAIRLNEMVIDFPGEYEKSGVLLNLNKIQDKFLFNLRVEDKNIAYIPYDTLEITEEVVDFFGNIDVLIILGDKNAAKIFENLESRVVVPYGPDAHQFLTTLGQHAEPVAKYKTKETDFESDNSLFVNLA